MIKEILDLLKDTDCKSERVQLAKGKINSQIVLEKYLKDKNKR